MHLQLSTGAPDLIAAAVTELGLEIGGMDTPISINPVTERHWRPRFDVKTLLHEERMLQAAAYIVCAYLTGMRDCEVQAMRPGCLSLTRSEDGVIDREGVAGLASSLGYEQRQVRRLLVTELGAGPLALARAQRAQTARTLVETTSLPMGDIAFAAGFSSIRQFNATMLEVFDTPPTRLREQAIRSPRPPATRRPARRAPQPPPPGVIRLRLPYRPPIDFPRLLGFLAARGLKGLPLSYPATTGVPMPMTGGLVARP